MSTTLSGIPLPLKRESLRTDRGRQVLASLDGQNAQELNTRFAALVDESRALLEGVQRAGRKDLTAAETNAFDDAQDLIEEIRRRTGARHPANTGRKVSPLSDHNPFDGEDRTMTTQTRAPALKDAQTGQLVRGLGIGESHRDSLRARRPDLVDEICEREGLELGDVVAAMLTPSRARPEVKRVLSESLDGTGSLAVNAWLSTGVLDLLRERDVTARAGALDIPLDETADKYHFLAIANDPTPTWREELDPVDESEPVFRRVTFVPRVVAVIIPVSREMLEDSTNAGLAIQTSIAGAFAREKVRVGLMGSGDPPEPAGVVQTQGVHQVPMLPTPTDYASILRARRLILEATGREPTAVILSPERDEQIELMTAAPLGQQLERPRSLRETPFYPTQLTIEGGGAGPVFVADWRWLWYGMRTQLRVEILRELRASTMEVAFLAHMRMDVAVVHPAAFAMCDPSVSS